MIANYHTHTTRCHHAEGEDRQYVETAIERGLKILGFSDHTPYYYDGDYVSGVRMLPEEVEGYVESISSGMVAALNAINRFKNENKKIIFSEYTVIGALAKYISTENDKFQPMNANFGILPALDGKKIRDKRERYLKLAERSLKYFEK